MSQPIDIPRRNKKTPSPPPNPHNLPEGLYSLRHHLTVPIKPRYIPPEWTSSRNRVETTTFSATTSNPQPPPQSSKTRPRKASTPAKKSNLSRILEGPKEKEKRASTKITKESEAEDEDEWVTTEEEVEEDSTEERVEEGKEGKEARNMNRMD